jgi:ribonuclease P protein component
VGSAVVRNRVRRQLREIFWSTVDDLRVNADLVVSARPPAVNASFGDLKGEFLRALRKLELLEREG